MCGTPVVGGAEMANIFNVHCGKREDRFTVYCCTLLFFNIFGERMLQENMPEKGPEKGSESYEVLRL